MSFSLHTATVGAYLQILPSLAGLVAKAEAHCAEKGLPAEALTGASLAEGMWPFAKQITSAVHHSSDSIAGVLAGTIGPDLSPAPTDFASLHTALADAIAMLQAVEPAEIDGLTGGDMRFAYGEHHMDFLAEDFLLTFALPNFYFHATTAYDVLRHNGLALRKMDYIGRPRLKG